MKKSTSTVYGFIILFALFSLVGWCVRHCSTPKVINAISVGLESKGIDSLSETNADDCNKFMRIRFSSLKDVKLDFRKFEMGDLDDYTIEVKIRLKDGRLLKSETTLMGIQDGNDLILKGADFHKRWHTSEEYDAFSQISAETVKSIYVRISEERSPNYPTVFSKRFTSFDAITESEADNYCFDYRNVLR